jgi:HK97 family phage major capsid protein
MSMDLDFQTQADAAAKAKDIERLANGVREAWRRDFPWPEPEQVEARPATDWPPEVSTVRDDGVVIFDGKTGQYYLVAYHRQDDGQFAFAPRGEWQPVEPNWAPVTKALDGDVETDPASPDDESTKAGARNSATDRQHIRDIRAMAQRIINATTTLEPTDDEDQYSELREAMAAQDMVATIGGTEVKALGAGKVGGHLIVFGDQNNTDLSRYRDYFAPDTDYGLDADGSGKSIVLYHHGLDGTLDTRKLAVGTLKMTDVGVWVEAQLSMRDAYEEELLKLVEAGKMGWSSGTASHLVKRQKQPNGSHKITQWWLGLDASITPRPAEPRTRVLPIKAWQEEAEPALKALSQAGAQPADDAASAQDTPPTAIVNPNLETQISEVKMNEEELKALLAQVAQQAADAATKAVLDKQAANEPPINGSPGFATGSNDANGAADAATKSFNALYVTRFGDEDDAMKAVMSDMFGSDYRQVVQDQRRAFARYLRFGEPELDGNARKALRTQIFPPEVVKSMLVNGYDVAEIKATQVEAQGTLGGYAVPPGIQSEIIKRLPGLTAVRGGGARVHTLEKTNSTEMPAYSGGTSQYVGALRGAWGNETATPAEKNFSMTLETVIAHIYTFKVPMSQSLVEDAANLVQLVTEDIATTMSIDEDIAFLTGNGVGKPLGLLPGGANAHSLTEVLSLSGTTLTAAGVKKLKRGVATQYRKGAIWVGESDTFGTIETLESGTGSGYVFPDLSEDDMLLKCRVFESEAMPTVGSGTFPLLFGQMSGYWIVEKPGLTIVRFQDSNTGINKVEFHVRKRVGGRPVETWKFAVQKVAAS